MKAKFEVQYTFIVSNKIIISNSDNDYMSFSFAKLTIETKFMRVFMENKPISK